MIQVNYEKILLIISSAVIAILLICGVFGYIGYKQLESTLRESISDVDRIIELERTIAGYDKSIGELELRESNIRIREQDIDIRKSEIELREADINHRFIEITNGEADLVRRKRELEENSRIKLTELVSEIKKSRELVERIKSNNTGSDYNLGYSNN